MIGHCERLGRHWSAVQLKIFGTVIQSINMISDAWVHAVKAFPALPLLLHPLGTLEILFRLLPCTADPISVEDEDDRKFEPCQSRL